MNFEILNLIVVEIKKKKQLSKLDDSIVLEKVKLVINSDKKLIQFIESANIDKISKSKLFKQIVKLVRNDLNRIYGQFFVPAFFKTNFSEQLLSFDFTNSSVKDLMKLHLSTKERIKFYDSLISELVDFVSKSDIKLLDLASGYNPLSSIFYFDCGVKSLDYSACELNKTDVSNLNDFFDVFSSKNKKFKGQAHVLDISDFDSVSHKLFKQKYDLVLIWKTFDLIDKKQAEQIINNLNCAKLVISFSTKTLKNQNMKVKRRGGFQRMFNRLGFEYVAREYENELFYFLTRKMIKLNVE
ncbi:hypothetical protein HN587_04285 [Candidatus Woesearchaeota archaeon]|jgi:hypothetical protein|nr:hypothetical protein [Candidatus Woesearchaeota archaeon]